MTSVGAIQTNSLLFYLFSIPFFLLIALALEELNTCDQTPIGSATIDETSRLVAWGVTILARGMPATPTHVLSRSMSAVKDFRDCGPRTTTVHHQFYYSEDSWSPIQPSGDQATRQPTIRQKIAQPTSWLQNPFLPKVLS